MSERGKNFSNGNNMEDEQEENSVASQKAAEYIKKLLAEKLLIDAMDGESAPIASRLLDEEITKARTLGRIPPHAPRYVNVYKDKPIKVAVKVIVPVRQHPKFNFMGKLLGPKGNTLKRLQEESMCRITILGKGSMKDHVKEEELRKSLDPKYGHLSEDLHVEISALCPPAEAYGRIGFALTEIKKYLTPDRYDDIAQEQFREMESYIGEPVARPKRPPPPIGGGIRPPPGGSRMPPRGPVPTPRLMPAKAKIMSILDRARAAMEESYGLSESYRPSSPSYYDSPRPNKFAPDRYDDYDDDDDYYKGGDTYEAPTRSWKPTPFSKPRPGSSAPFPRYKSSPYSRP